MEALTSLLSWQHIVATVAVYVASIAFYRLFLHPLARFPGPKLAALTRSYEAYYDIARNGQYTFKIAELHKKYGESYCYNTTARRFSLLQAPSSGSAPGSSISSTLLSLNNFTDKTDSGTSTLGPTMRLPPRMQPSARRITISTRIAGFL